MTGRQEAVIIVSCGGDDEREMEGGKRAETQIKQS